MELTKEEKELIASGQVSYRLDKSDDSWVTPKKHKGSNKFTRIYFFTCPQCNTLFVHKSKNKKYCSSECCSKASYERNRAYYEALREKNRVRYTNACVRCSESFKTQFKHAKYCSEECRTEKDPNYCRTCGKEILGARNKKYCSVECKTPKKPKKECKTCSKELPSRSLTYCSKECKPARRSFYQKIPKQTLACKTCGNRIKGKKSTLYCKKTCSPSHKEAKRLRKRRKKQARLNCIEWTKLSEIYKKCPDGHQVDHIIPLNHIKVCGLHVPWNLQYLTVEDNALKSNKFDGTNENNSWKLGA